MHNIVIADTCGLILFNKTGELDLFRKVYDSVSITPEIADKFSQELSGWIKIEFHNYLLYCCLHLTGRRIGK